MTQVTVRRSGSTTGILLLCSAAVACAVGAGLFAAKVYTPNDASIAVAPEPDVTKSQYEALSKGMEYNDVAKSLCRQGTLKTSCTLELRSGRQVQTNLYMYENSDGSNCMLVFQDEVLRVKSQAGLQ